MHIDIEVTTPRLKKNFPETEFRQTLQATVKNHFKSIT